jgi:hypothetical protein
MINVKLKQDMGRTGNFELFDDATGKNTMMCVLLYY